jgi:hypothetical protein
MAFRQARQARNAAWAFARVNEAGRAWRQQKRPFAGGFRMTSRTLTAI